MHSYLNTQISQELWYYGLHAVAVCTKVNSCVEGVGVNKATPNRSLHWFHLDGHSGEDELGDRGSEHKGHDHIIIKRTEENRTRPEDGWKEGMMGKEGLRAWPCSDS